MSDHYTEDQFEEFKAAAIAARKLIAAAQETTEAEGREDGFLFLEIEKLPSEGVNRRQLLSTKTTSELDHRKDAL